jgi:hypothetical protein
MTWPWLMDGVKSIDKEMRGSWTQRNSSTRGDGGTGGTDIGIACCCQKDREREVQGARTLTSLTTHHRLNERQLTARRARI